MDERTQRVSDLLHEAGEVTSPAEDWRLERTRTAV
jgi:hypothetical protein